MKFEMTPEMRLNPYPMYAMMRENGGLLPITEHNLVNVFRYEDVKTVLTDHKRFSSAYSPDPDTASLVTTDPPRHTQLRGLVTRAFTPRTISALEPRIRQLTTELLDPVIESGQIDLVKDLAEPLPVMVIAEMLGIPAEERVQFKHWSDQVVAAADAVMQQQQSGEPDSFAQAKAEMAAYFRRIIAERRAEPQDDLISQLIAAEVDGERLSEQDILNFCWLLLVAGNETTTNLISNAIITLLEHPNAMRRLKAEPELLPVAIEEFLRYRSPVQAMFRIAAQDVEIAGQTIAAGSRVIAWIGSANRDETVFADADQLVLTRDPNPHIAFGHGIHFCLGAPLARLEARIALEAILDRLDDLARADEEPLEPVSGFIVMGVRRLPLTFRPGPVTAQ